MSATSVGEEAKARSITVLAQPRRQTSSQGRTSPNSTSDRHELFALKKKLVASAESQATRAILQTATIQELRGIKRSMGDIDINPTLMEWTTALFLVAVRHPEEPLPSTVHQWNNAKVFIHERTKARNLANKGENWMKQNQKMAVPDLIKEYQGISAAALKFLADRHLKYFFNGMLCFASHYAKHAVCLKVKVAAYLQKAEELYSRTPFMENGAKCYRKNGWCFYVTSDIDRPYIKTLHLKASYHEQYLANL